MAGRLEGAIRANAERDVRGEVPERVERLEGGEEAQEGEEPAAPFVILGIIRKSLGF